jgi:hypothetical protein
MRPRLEPNVNQQRPRPETPHSHLLKQEWNEYTSQQIAAGTSMLEIAPLTNLAPSASLLVLGNSGLAITNGINKSTYGKMLADDHVSARIISRAHLSS